MERFG
ncbi:hypothetical protein VCHE16_2528, partial [Vibrio paracholerae HE-16]